MAKSKFKRIVLKLLKWFGIVVALILVILSIVVIVNLNYDKPSLYVSEENLQKEYANTDTKVMAKNLVAQMSLDEKIAQMYGEPYASGMAKLATNFLVKKRFAHIYVGENKRLGIPPWVLSDGPRGARVLGKDVKGVTTFPVGMARGASWNPDLEYRINQVIASEMRANKVNYAATPCINLLRHPGWGRAQETYGEDPWLLGEFGVAAVKGLEKHNIMACPKHFALNSIENSRWVVDVEVDERTLREVYLPHFKKTVQKGKPASIMSAYNAVNGEFCGSNKELLTHILRDDWGFEGFVTTDWLMGVYDGIKGVQAGLDVEMPFQQVYTQEVIQEGLDSGEISESDIDKIVTRSLSTRLKYALIDDQDNYPTSDIGKPSSIELAREAAEESMVLLKNEGILPFKNQEGKTIAVIGRLADLENTGDRGSSDSKPLYVETPFEGIQKHHQAQGNKVILDDGSDLERAKELAGNADEIVLVVGFTHEDEGEYIIFSREQMEEAAEAGKSLGKVTIGGDREDLSLLEQDEMLIKALHPMNDNLAVVYVGGSAIDMSTWEDDVPAILFSWYSGMEGGTALANILYGNANPSGKLPFSIAKNQKDYPPFTPYTKNFKYGYYHGYTLFDKKGTTPAYPFGFGLSYTNFTYDSLAVKTQEISMDDLLEVEVNVSNTGEVDGKEVVQLYIGFSNSTVDRPVKLLRGFKKVHLKAGETKKALLDVAAKDLAWYNPATENWEVESMTYELYIGSSSAKNDLLQSTFIVK
ncbi:beta-glucosidase [Ulvibacterium marinum]|uniref:Glycosyl hydrolase n=1 Tax=Ulvibacterium marinum TaxID=2419782 RepID=A0A3B0C740_9FLAO|nr:glycoside hydrolase family 3 C-terminal domain-containing protein [Ulvibacterium marinum]RKN80089.1 glycosyl hydrolase [Ulvibacterium marinum]